MASKRVLLTDKDGNQVMPITDGKNVYIAPNKTIYDALEDGEILVTSVPVDDEISDESENAIQNKIIKQYVDNKTLDVAPEMHRVIFRGKNLGTTVTQAQKTAIQNGTFNDLFLGDYWVINATTWRIVDMDYWYNTGRSPLLMHHIVIMPDTCLYQEKMNNSTATTSGGYVGSDMYTNNLTQTRNYISSIFENSVLTHDEYLSNAITDGVISGMVERASTVEIPNERMMYGTNIHAPISSGNGVFQGYTYSKTQFALFAIAPRFITNRAYYWLRDATSSAQFARVDGHGLAQSAWANERAGIRPYFCIG